MLMGLSVPLIVAGCSISTEEEVRMGVRAAPEFEAQSGGRLANEVLQQYIREVGQKVADVSDRQDVKYEYVLLNSRTPNAFSLPGGKIYITAGLVSRLENERELASALAHETGHVSARHNVKELQRRLGASVLVEAAGKASSAAGSGGGLAGGGGLPGGLPGVGGIPGIGGLPTIGGTAAPSGAGAAGTAAGGMMPGAGDVVPAVAKVATEMVVLRYSRQDEYEADQLGIRYAERAGYNPWGLPEMLEVVLSLSESEGSTFSEIVSTHPLTTTRIGEARVEIEKKYPDYASSSPDPNAKRFLQMRDLLRSIMYK